MTDSSIRDVAGFSEKAIRWIVTDDDVAAEQRTGISPFPMPTVIVRVLDRQSVSIVYSRLEIEIRMPKSVFVGEFEQLVLLALLKLGDEGYALLLREELGRISGRRPTRGALYRTLERLEGKRHVTWVLEEATAERGGHARRRYTVTRHGIAALRASRTALLGLWKGLEEVLR